MNAETASLFSGALTKLRSDSSRAVPLVDRRELIDTSYSDDELLQFVSEGERDALTLLFRRHAPAVLNVARRVMRDHAEAEDLLQDVFLFVHQKARLFDPSKGTALSWIIQVTYHRALNRRKYLNTRQHYGVLEFNEELQGASVGTTTVDEVASRELLSKFRSELTEDQRLILELHFFEGYTFHEIAARTGQTFGSVRNRYYRGLERLRSLVFSKETRST